MHHDSPTQRDPRFATYQGVAPTVGQRVFVADNARLIGDVVVGDDASIWFGCVVRGDVHPIRIGARTNIQDLTVIHVTSRMFATHVGDGVTIGHRAILHGCTVEDGALIGMGATVMDGAIIGGEAMVGAGALVTPRTVIPPRSLAVGAPAKVKRALTAAEVASLAASAIHYVDLAADYR